MRAAALILGHLGAKLDKSTGSDGDPEEGHMLHRHDHRRRGLRSTRQGVIDAAALQCTEAGDRVMQSAIGGTAKAVDEGVSTGTTSAYAEINIGRIVIEADKVRNNPQLALIEPLYLQKDPAYLGTHSSGSGERRPTFDVPKRSPASLAPDLPACSSYSWIST